jgi:hypothetical protein
MSAAHCRPLAVSVGPGVRPGRKDVAASATMPCAAPRIDTASAATAAATRESELRGGLPLHECTRPSRGSAGVRTAGIDTAAAAREALLCAECGVDQQTCGRTTR